MSKYLRQNLTSEYIDFARRVADGEASEDRSTREIAPSKASTTRRVARPRRFISVHALPPPAASQALKSMRHDPLLTFGGGIAGMDTLVNLCRALYNSAPV